MCLEFIKRSLFLLGGHAALNDGENTFIEAVGFPKNDEKNI